MLILRLRILLACFLLSQSFVYATSDTSVIIADSTTITTKNNEESVEKQVLNFDKKAFAFTNQSVDAHTVEFQWLVDSKYAGSIDSVIIRYSTNTSSDDDEAIEWEYTIVVEAKSGKFLLENLKGSESYIWEMGYSKIGKVSANFKNSDAMIWSDKGKFEIERDWGIGKILILIGSLGMFIYGMKVMSDGLQQSAGSRLRGMLGSITSNRVKGVLTGFGITSLVQSSSVTTVMTVSFVNAGLLTLTQSAGIMMGANIGTTITGWLINFFGFKVSLDAYAFMFIAIGAPMMFFGKRKLKGWASAIIGFALLFMGLGALKDNVPTLGPDSALVQFFVNYSDIPVISTLLFVGLGAMVTVIIQSSSAAMALTMTLVAADIIPFEVACAMILGENIGTTITAELASSIGNVHAKRSARIHSMFNLVGVTWMVIVFPLAMTGLLYMQDKVFGWGDPIVNVAARNTGLALFHTGFNLLNVLLLIWFVPQLVRFAERTVKSKGGADEEFRLDYIGGDTFISPEIAILEAKKEVAKFGNITSRMNGFTKQLLSEPDSKEKIRLYSKIKKYEEITDKVEVEVADFLGKISSSEMTNETSAKVSAMNSITNDLERIGDIYYQMSKQIERKDEYKCWFSPAQRNGLNEMIDLIEGGFEEMCSNLNSEYETVTLDKANSIETSINEKRNKLRKKYLKNLERDTYNKRTGMIYNDLFSSLEKVGDHIINVTEALVETQKASL